MSIEKPSNTSQRLKSLMAERHLRQVDILALCAPICEKHGIKMNKSSLSQYVTGSSVPDQYKLTILGIALNVSEAWLMGYDVPMEREHTSSVTLSQVKDWLKYAATKNEKIEIVVALFSSSPKEDAREYLNILVDLMTK